MTFNIEAKIKSLVASKSWKSFFIMGIIALGVLILLDSIFFTLILALIKLVLGFGALALLIYSAYLAYPIVVKKVVETRKTQ